MIATIEIVSETVCRVKGLELNARKELQKKFSFFQPHARYTPDYKMGRWDGRINFFSIGGSTYVGLLPEIVPAVIDLGYSLEVDDRRVATEINPDAIGQIDENFFSDYVWPEGHKKAGQPITLREDQVESTNKFIENLPGSAVQEVATGGGKTLITAALSRKFEPYGRTIIIVPNKDLVRQTRKSYHMVDLDVGVYYGDEKTIGAQHTICTWQSLEAISKRHQSGESDMSLSDFAEGAVAVIVDECHGVAATVLKKILVQAFGHVPVRIGFTGTIPKDVVAATSLKIAVGPVINQVSARTLQEKGILSWCEVDVLQLKDNMAFNSYATELKFLTTDEKRLAFIADLVKNVEGNALVLVDRIQCGQILTDLIDGAEFVHGSTKNRDRIYSSVTNETNSRIVATFGVAAVGIDVPEIDHLFLIEPGKSFVRVIQSIGRALRRGVDSDYAHIWDVTSNCKFAKRHLTERKKFYREAGYPFNITKVDY